MSKLVAMIPARLGSQRLKKKNLELFGDKTLIEHAIYRCQKAEIFDEIYVNSESTVFEAFAQKYGVNFHLRPESLGSNTSTSEEFVEDFLRSVECESLIQIHSITPLLAAEEIRKFANFCIKNPELNTVLSCIEDQIEVAYKNVPVNFSETIKTNSQELLPTQRITWAATKWDSNTYLSAKDSNQVGTYSGAVGYYKVGSYSGLAIKTELDLNVANALREVL